MIVPCRLLLFLGENRLDLFVPRYIRDCRSSECIVSPWISLPF